MNSSANIIIYFNSDVLINMSEGVAFICEKPAYFCILYTMSFAELESGVCQCIEDETPKIVEKIRYRCPISIFGGFIQYQAIPIYNDDGIQQMFRINQSNQAQVPVVALYVDFRKVTIVDDEEEEHELSTFPEREVKLEQNISDSDDEEKRI